MLAHSERESSVVVAPLVTAALPDGIGKLKELARAEPP
jgi:hypothetical protein